MEKFVQQAFLFDFYGELLTEHQRQIYEDVVCNDFSCSEVAAQQGVSRQGIHDLIRRCDRQLEEYERKLHLVERFLEIQAKVRSVRTAAGRLLEEDPKGDSASQEAEGRQAQVRGIVRLCDEILEEL